MMLKIWFGIADAMSLSDNQTSFGKIKALLRNWLDDQIVILRSLRAEGGLIVSQGWMSSMIQQSFSIVSLIS